MWDGNRKGIMIIIIKQLLVFWDLFPLASLQFNKWIWHHYWAGDKLALFPLVYLLRPLKVKVAQSCPILRPHGLYSPWDSPVPNTRVGSLSLLQGIFPTKGSNPGLPHCGRILYQLSHQGSPRILEWVAYPFSCRCSQPRNWTGVSCIAGGFLTSWATRESHSNPKHESSLR